MSEERELLGKILVAYRKDNSCMSWGVARDIEYLLAQPEGLTPREGLAEYKKGYAKAELDLKREPLSNEEIEAIWGQDSLGTTAEFVRAIEKAHGIGGEE